MSLPTALKDTLTPQEIQFITENGNIEILPRYSMNSIDLITTRIPKLIAMQRASVPLWFAVLLKQQKKCSIIPPNWLNLNSLREFYTTESTKVSSFSDLPSNWLELVKLFFEFAQDDLDDEVFKYKQVVQDLKEIRMVKVKKGLALINESNLQLDNLSIIEINEMRPFLVKTMQKLAELDESVREE